MKGVFKMKFFIQFCPSCKGLPLGKSLTGGDHLFTFWCFAKVLRTGKDKIKIYSIFINPNL